MSSEAGGDGGDGSVQVEGGLRHRAEVVTPTVRADVLHLLDRAAGQGALQRDGDGGAPPTRPAVRRALAERAVLDAELDDPLEPVLQPLAPGAADLDAAADELDVERALVRELTVFRRAGDPIPYLIDAAVLSKSVSSNTLPGKYFFI